MGKEGLAHSASIGLKREGCWESCLFMECRKWWDIQILLLDEDAWRGDIRLHNDGIRLRGHRSHLSGALVTLHRPAALLIGEGKPIRAG